MSQGKSNLDSILVEVGEFGKYQRQKFVFNLAAIAICYFSYIIYIFETKQINYRCTISGCDKLPFDYDAWWVKNAIPFKNSKPSKCTKFVPINISNNQSCQEWDFNQEITELCSTFVYASTDITILQDFNLQCDENIWKLTLVGTIHNCGVLIGLPFTGALSDRFGRKTVLVFGMIISGVIGVIRSFSNSYPLFLSLEILEVISNSGSFGIIWILGVETIGPKQRIFVSQTLNAFSAVGGIIEGLVAWQVQSWRVLLQILYSFHFTFIFYYWLMPESIQWLLQKKKILESKEILQKIAKVNGKLLSENNLKDLELEMSKENNIKDSISKLLHSKILTRRLIICSLCWLCSLFLNVGLNIHAVALSNNSNFDFILAMLVEIPAALTCLIIDKVGRRKMLATGFSITSLSCITFIFIPLGKYWIRLPVYLLGKFAISFCVALVYTVTIELFPTSFRNTLLAICAMFGRIGSMAAPQMTLLETFWAPLPSILFGCCGAFGAVLIFFCPETTGIQLPNTIEEAENIGKRTSINSTNL